MEDRAASILAKLKNKAVKSKIPYQQCLQLFAQEEFLRKLSHSFYANNLVLKGGLFIYILTNFKSRPTMDVDFLLSGYPNTLNDIKIMLDTILNVNTGNDFISMSVLNFEPITKQRKYPGISAQIFCKIKNVRIYFNVDIGVGDIIFPKIEKRTITTQLTTFESPVINTYSLESTIAEKLDAIIERLELTSRMKDFYDIYYLSKTFDFDGLKLQEAIFRTLNVRNTYFDKDTFKHIDKLKNNERMNNQWKRFLENFNITELSFFVVIGTINDFLEPVLASIISDSKWDFRWNSEIGWIK